MTWTQALSGAARAARLGKVLLPSQREKRWESWARRFGTPSAKGLLGVTISSLISAPCFHGCEFAVGECRLHIAAELCGGSSRNLLPAPSQTVHHVKDSAVRTGVERESLRARHAAEWPAVRNLGCAQAVACEGCLFIAAWAMTPSLQRSCSRGAALSPAVRAHLAPSLSASLRCGAAVELPPISCK